MLGAVNLDSRTCYQALRSRDPRFDGRFFTAVKTTGVYCRPVCPARTPKLENIEFYACAAAAEDAGFRPCLRCRPETSPGTPAWLGTSATVSRGLRLIEAGALDDSGVEALAARLGIGGRHLRRLFLRHLGATPLAVARTRRVQLAKRLLDDTGLPITELAFAAGFSSVRRFNAAIREVYGRSPTELRRSRGGGRGVRAQEQCEGERTTEAAKATGPVAVATSELRLRLAYRPPYDWDSIASFLGTRAVPGVECVSDGIYRRSVRIGDAVGSVSVQAATERPTLDAVVRISDPAALAEISRRLVRLFDLGADPGPIAEQLGSDPALAATVRARPGLRVPGAWDPFELAVRAILGQQVTVAGARTIAGRLVERFGTPLDRPEGELTHLFPTAEQIAGADLSGLGVPGARARALGTLADAMASGRIRLEPGSELDETVAELTCLAGIGPWTAHYIAMRALGEPDALPHGDLGLLHALSTSTEKMTAKELHRRAEAWRPWRAYATMHLWLSLENNGEAKVKQR